MLQLLNDRRIKELSDDAAATIAGGRGQLNRFPSHHRFRTPRIMLPRVMIFPSISEDDDDDGLITTEERFSQEIFTEESSSDQEVA